MPPAPPSTKPAAVEPSALRQRRDILTALKGPVAERLRKLIPTLAPLDDPYRVVIESPELLYGCLQVFRTKRQKFADLLVDEQGRPVEDDDSPLSCGRSVNDIIGMIVRSCARQYALKRFVDPETKPHVVEPETRTFLERLARLVTGKWSRDELPKPRPSRSYAEEFYDAIRDGLDYEWQVPLVPHYAELPARLIRELGRGLTTLRNPAAIHALANIGRHDMTEARRILSNDMMREMLDTQPLAAQGIAYLGKEKYEYLHNAVYGRMGARFWEMCKDTDRLEAMEDKNARDLGEMAGYLHLVGPETITHITDKLELFQIATFLDIAWRVLGEAEFIAIFGLPGRPSMAKRLAEKAAAFKLDPTDPAKDFTDRLPDVFKAYLLSPKNYERGL